LMLLDGILLAIETASHVPMPRSCNVSEEGEIGRMKTEAGEIGRMKTEAGEIGRMKTEAGEIGR